MRRLIEKLDREHLLYALTAGLMIYGALFIFARATTSTHTAADFPKGDFWGTQLDDNNHIILNSSFDRYSWGFNDVDLSATSSSATAPAVDGSGGAYDAYQVNRGTAADVYVQHVDSNGTVLWGTPGLQVSTTSATQNVNPVLASDSAGNAFVMYQHGCNPGVSSECNEFVQKINTAGVVQWPAGGVQVSTTSETQQEQLLVPDGAGGVFAIWKGLDTFAVGFTLHVQHLNSSGAIQMPAGGRKILYSQPAAISDGSGGLIMLYTESTHLRAQHMNGTGTDLWTSGGVLVASSSFGIQNPQLDTDGSGGIITAWGDQRYGIGTDAIFAQRLDSTGAIKWTANGVQISPSLSYGPTNNVVSDGAGGAIIDYGYSNYKGPHVYVQRVDPNGNLLWGSGKSIFRGQRTPYQMISDTLGGAYLLNSQYYVQHIDSNGAILWNDGGFFNDGWPGLFFGALTGAGGFVLGDAHHPITAGSGFGFGATNARAFKLNDSAVKQYVASGPYIGFFKANATVDWSGHTLDVAATTPTGTAVTAETCAYNDPAFECPSNNWIALSGNVIQSTVGNVLAYRLTLTTSDPTITPVVTSVTADVPTAPVSGPQWTVQYKTPGWQHYWQSISGSADGTKWVAADDEGQLYTSLDGGITWNEDLNHSAPRWDDALASNGNVYALDEDSFAYRSTDNGSTWNAIESLPMLGWYHIAGSADGTNLAAIANTYDFIYVSHDGGANWTKQSGVTEPTDPYGAIQWSDIVMSDDGQKIFATPDSNSTTTSFYSSNGGTSWSPVYPQSGQKWWALALSGDGSHLYAYDYNLGDSSVQVSTNHGSTWTTLTNSGNHSWIKLHASSDGSVVAGVTDNHSSDGYVYFSTDTGANWTQASVPLAYWSALGMSGDGSKMIAGADYIPARFDGASPLYRSADTGTTWSAIDNLSNADSPYSWASFALSADGTKVAAGTFYALIYTSPDGGATWRTSDSIDAGWYGIAGSSDGTKLAAVADSDHVYTSSDSGATWTQQAGSPSVAWRSIASNADGSKLVAAATGDYIYTSTDSGVNWTQQSNPGTNAWTSVSSSADGQTLAAATGGDYIYTSTDGGAHWSARIGSGQRAWMRVDSSADGQTLIASVTGGDVFVSTDGGANWSDQAALGVNNWAVSVSADGTRLAAATGDSSNMGYIYISDDDGATWQQQLSAGARAYVAIHMSSDGTKLAAMTDGSYDGVMLTATIPAAGAPSTPPSVASATASGISSTTATLNGSITSIGSGNATVRGFAYGASSAYGATTTENGSFGIGAFTTDLAGLSCGSVYHFAAYAINAGGVAYGGDQSFAASACPGAPTVSTAAASSITDTGATLNGSIDDTGGTSVLTRGFVYGATAGYGATTTESGSFGTGAFSASIASLTCGTTYHFASYSDNGIGLSYSADAQFTTAACAVSGGGSPPAPASNGAPSGSGVGKVDGPLTPRGFQSVLDGPTSVVTGASATYTVTAKSLFGQPLTQGGDSVAIIISGANGGKYAAKDNGNGTYTFTLIPQKAGDATVSAQINGESVRHDSADNQDDGRITLTIGRPPEAPAAAAPTRSLENPSQAKPEEPAKHVDTKNIEKPAVTPVPNVEPEPQKTVKSGAGSNPAATSSKQKAEKQPEKTPPQQGGSSQATSTGRTAAKDPVTIDSGLTAACFPSFAWSGQQSVAKIYRTVGTGAETKIATLNKKTQWFIDTAPVIGEDLTYRFEFPSQETVTIVIPAVQTNACRSLAPVQTAGSSPAVSQDMPGAPGGGVVSSDIDRDGNPEQIIDGIVIDTDGSSAQVGSVAGRPLVDIDGDGSPDVIVRADGSAASIVASGALVLVPSESLLTFYTPPQDAGAFGVSLRHGDGVAAVSYAVSGQAYAAHQIAPQVRLSSPAQAATALAGSSGGLALAVLGASEVPLSFSSLWLMLVHGWLNLLEVLSIRKRRRPWGVVYDSVSKLPIDPAYVELIDANGAVVTSAITDLEGRYGFLTVPGEYRIRASKTNYMFPSARLEGMGRDLLYEDLYFGEPLSVGIDAIAKNIPIDPVGVDWNQVEKKKQGLSSVGLNDRYAALALDTLFYGGFLLVGWQFLSHPSIPMALVGAAYSAIALLQFWFGKPRLFGVVRDSSGSPLSFGIVKFSTQTGFLYATKVLDERGRYVALLTPGTYVMTIERRIDAEHTEIVYRSTVRARRGMVSANAVIEAR